MAEDKYILSSGEGDNKTEHLIERVIHFEGGHYFTIIDLASGSVMFGEYTGELPKDDDLAREVICNDFRSGCKHIAYPDGYIVDDLYEMIDMF